LNFPGGKIDMAASATGQHPRLWKGYLDKGISSGPLAAGLF
jgi:hypothetical protein